MKQFTAVFGLFIFGLFALPLMAGPPPIDKDIKIEVESFQADVAPIFMTTSTSLQECGYVDIGPPAICDVTAEIIESQDRNLAHKWRRQETHIQNNYLEKSPYMAVRPYLRC